MVSKTAWKIATNRMVNYLPKNHMVSKTTWKITLQKPHGTQNRMERYLSKKTHNGFSQNRMVSSRVIKTAGMFINCSAHTMAPRSPQLHKLLFVNLFLKKVATLCGLMSILFQGSPLCNLLMRLKLLITWGGI